MVVALAAIVEVDSTAVAVADIAVVVATVAAVVDTGYSFVVAVAAASLHNLDNWAVVA